MRRFKRVAVTAVAVFAFGAGAFAMAKAQDAPQGDVSNGKRLYLADGCFTCHGRSGQGGNYRGPAPILAKTAMEFEAFASELRNPANEMPAYSDAVLSDQDVADIYAFVESLPGPGSAKDISILNN